MQRRDALLWCAGAVLVTPARSAQPRLRSERRVLFGSPIELQVPADTAGAVTDAVLAGLQTMNRRWNAWKPGDVTALNAAFRAGRAATAGPALCAMIRGAAWIEQRSLGCFNAGIGGLVGAWGFHADTLLPGHRPGADALAPWRLRPPSLAQLEIRGTQVFSHNPALQLDFGGYAKGVALDWALDRLQAGGTRHALLNLGGNLATRGQAGGRPWVIGLRDPHGPGLFATVATQGREAVVTSGSYERFRMLDGKRCTHILDPRSGAPTPASGLVSVTVLHASAALADAAATALLVAGPSAWPAVAGRLGVSDVVVVDGQGQVSATPSLRPRLMSPPQH